VAFARRIWLRERRTPREKGLAHNFQPGWSDACDAFLYAFSTAADAVNAAIEAQETLAHERAPVRARIGLHTGEPTATGEGYVGLDVQKGARIAAAAHGGQILVSQATRDLKFMTLRGVPRRTMRVHDTSGAAPARHGMRRRPPHNHGREPRKRGG
jgi:hypothetical protein